MSATFLVAVAVRASDAQAECVSLGLPLPPPSVPIAADAVLPSPPPPLPPPAAETLDRWRSGLREVDSLYRATSSAPGSSAIAFTRDGSCLLTRAFEGEDDKIGVYSIADGALRSFDGHTDMISAVCIDGDRLASACLDGSVRLWDMHTGRCFARTMNGTEVKGVCLCGNFLVSGDAANRAKLWQLHSGDSERVWKGYKDESADGGGAHSEVILSACDQEAVHLGSVYCVGVTASGGATSVGWNQRDLKFWGTDGVRREVTTTAPVLFAMTIAGEIVYLGLRNGRVVGYLVNDGTITCDFASNSANKEVTCIMVSGELLVAGTEYPPQGLRVWSLAGPKPVLLTTHNPRHAVTSLAFCPASGLLASTGADTDVELWEPDTD